MEQCFKNFNNFATRIYVKLISWSLILFLIQPIILISREEEKKKEKKIRRKKTKWRQKFLLARFLTLIRSQARRVIFPPKLDYHVSKCASYLYLWANSLDSLFFPSLLPLPYSHKFTYPSIHHKPATIFFLFFFFSGCRESS